MLNSFHQASIAWEVVHHVHNWPIYFKDLLGWQRQPYILRTTSGQCLIRPHSIDRWVATENLVLDQYHLAQLRSLPVTTILDVGANIGSFAIAAAHVFPHAHIHCFEPHAENFARLTQNVIFNQLSGHITAHRAAVTVHENTTVNLYLSHDHATHSTVVTSNHQAEVPNVPITRLSKYCQGMTLLKLDIEGGEDDFFEDERADLLRRFSVILLEHHHLHDAPARILSVAQRIGFHATMFNDRIINLRAPTAVPEVP